MTQAKPPTEQATFRIHYVSAAPEEMLADSFYRQLNAQLATGFPEVRLRCVSPEEALEDPGDLLLTRADWEGVHSWVPRLPRENTYVALAVDERDPVPELWVNGRVEDLWVFPVRTSEIAQKIRVRFWMREQYRLRKMGSDLEKLVKRLNEDLEFAAVLKDQHRPKRIPDAKGIRVSSRYFAGVKAGGDYFDLLESSDSQSWLLWMTDTSSYGLSSAVVSTLSAMGAEIVAHQSIPGLAWVKSFCLKLGPQLARKGTLGGFWGVLSRKDLVLRYLSFGEVAAYRMTLDGRVEEIPGHTGHLTATQGWNPEWVEKRVQLSPGERVVMLSDGFVRAAGGGESVQRFLESRPIPFRGASASEDDGIDERNRIEDGWIDELERTVKGNLATPDDLPVEDCSILILTLDAKMLRLA